MIEYLTAAERILKVLKKESRCLTFDELYRKAQLDRDWVSFAGVLKDLVVKGKVLYTLPHGADAGYYEITENGS